MRIVHLCSMDFGGAGKAAYRLHKGLQSISAESIFMVGIKHSDDHSVVAIGEGGNNGNRDDFRGEPGLWDKMYARWQNALKEYPNRLPGQEVFSDTSTTLNIFLSDEMRHADVVNLHWVAGILDYSGMRKGFSGKTVIWTLHDMNPFTGGCHYAGACTRYTESCGSCPQLASDDDDDVSHRIWQDKKNAYTDLKLVVVTPSRWLAECARSSSLFKNFPVHVIPYGMPLDVYHPYNKSDARKSFNIAENAKIVLFGADLVSNRRKGFSYLIDALRHYNSPYNDGIILVTFGNCGFTEEVTLKFPLINLGSIEDETILATVYSMADVFVLPSLEDNLPNTVLEALACGVPVVCFNIGGMPDMIDHRQNGYLARAFDVADLAQGIQWGLEKSQYKQLADSGVINMGLFSLGKQADAYSELYNASLRNGESNSKIAIATSIAPKNIDLQKSAITSWLYQGFKVVSVNTEPEIAILKSDFPDVTFVATKRDARETMGKPLIFLDDVFAALKSSPATVCGIINSDIHLRTDIPLYDFVASEAKAAFISGHRYDVENLSDAPGKLYLNGYDIFFFDTSLLDSLPSSPFCLGATWWDIWVPLAMILKNVPAKRIIAPLAFHVLHTNRWDKQEWLQNSSRLVTLIDSNKFDLSRCSDFVDNFKRFYDLPQGLYKLCRDFIIEHTQLIAPEQMLPEGIDPTQQAPSYAVTAIVSTYNAEKFFGDCICNLMGQSLYEKGQLEIIVINSGSEQNEERIAQYYIETHDHIVYQRTERESLYAAWNRAIKLAKGKYIVNANTDDTLRVDALEALAKALETYPDADLVYGDCALTRKPNDSFSNHHAYHVSDYPPYNPALGMLFCLLGPHPMWRKTLFNEIGLFDPTYRAAGDYEFQMRFIMAGRSAIHVPEVLSLFCQNVEGLSLATETSSREAVAIESYYRTIMPINRLYAVDPDCPAAVADAWVAQGNLSLAWSCPWLEHAPPQLDYAVSCYRKALEVDRNNQPALQNLCALMALQGNWRMFEYLADCYAPENNKLKTHLADKTQPDFIRVEAQPSVKPLVFMVPPA